MRTAICVLALLVTSSALPAPRAAAQDERVGVVLPFQGRRGAAIRQIVVRALLPRMSLLPQRSIRQSARSLGVSLQDATGLRRVAEEHGVDVFIRGEVQGNGRRMKALLHVLDSDGNEVAFREIPVFGAAGRRRLARTARDVVAQALESIQEREAEARARTEEEERRRREDGVEGSEGSAPAAEAERAEAGAPRGEPERPLLTLVALAGARDRDAQVSLASGGERRYQSGFFFQLGLRLTLRPLARKGTPAAAGFLLEGSFIGAPNVSSEVLMGGGNVDTTVYRASGLAGYVHPFERGSVGAALGFEHDRFDLEPNPVLPGVAYTSFRVEARGSVAIVPHLLSLDVVLALIRPFSANDLEAAFGEDLSVLGVSFRGGVGGRTDFGLVYGASAGFRRLSLDFAGAAADEAGEDGFDRSAEVLGHLGWALE